MKAFLAFLLIVAALAGLYYGYIFVVGKAFKTAPPQKDPVATTSLRETQSQQNDELMRRQRELIQQRQDRMRDMQRR
jgi:hypothetical protein